MERRVVRPIAGALLAGLLAVAGAACDGGGDESPSPELPGDLDVEQGELPDRFPEDEVPLPDAPVGTGAALGTGDERTWTIVYDVDNLRRAADRYRGRLERAGFEIEESFSADDEMGNLTSFAATGDDYIVTVFAGGTGGVAGENALSVTVGRGIVDAP